MTRTKQIRPANQKESDMAILIQSFLSINFDEALPPSQVVERAIEEWQLDLQYSTFEEKLTHCHNLAMKMTKVSASLETEAVGWDEIIQEAVREWGINLKGVTDFESQLNLCFGLIEKAQKSL